ncbi:MAG: 3-dehydroquinate synthase [Clostridiales Family XIII bacterium]|jgi:3-dehydroquinate synthase|nr:3-dehydroquinate synthase [Clostridiales Family XIII bacterium]
MGMNQNNDKKILTVGIEGRPYNIMIGSGVIAEAGALIAGPAGGSNLCVISDENVRALHGASLTDTLGHAGLKYFSFVIPPGEESKNIGRLSSIYDWFAEGGKLNRGGLVVAFGGGVVGDLAGFAAATWMRGVRYVQIPTTLLAMVDSSVGGKTAIDLKSGKNLVGAFHQPALVLIDPALLDTLPQREFGAGLAEVIKYGAIASDSLFKDIEYAAGAANAGQKSISERIRATLRIEDVIRDCCSIKAEIVGEDEFDTGLRVILNFGHTFGHAIESKYGFEKYNHGEAVAAGMRIAAVVGEKLGVTERGTAARIDALLRDAGLGFHERADDLVSYMKRDKKAVSGGVNLVLLKRIGDAMVHKIAWDELEAALQGE